MSRRTLAAGLLAAPLAHAQSLTQDPMPVASGRFAKAARMSAERGGVGFLVMRHGVILAEDYPNGGHYQGTIRLGHASKAYAPILAGSLMRDRLLGLDEPAFFTLPEWSSDPVKQRITVRQLLQQTSGLQPRPLTAPSPTLVEALNTPVVAEPGNAFAEGSAGFQMFTEIARRKLVESGGGAVDLGLYMQLRALDVVGAAPVAWARLSDGQIDLAQGGSCPLRAWARLGEFTRRRGLWRASFRLQPQALDAAVIGSLASRGRTGIGWRRADGDPPAAGEAIAFPSDLWGAADAPRDTVFALNEHGVRLMLIPSRALIIARAGPASPTWSDAALLRAVLNEE